MRLPVPELVGSAAHVIAVGARELRRRSGWLRHWYAPVTSAGLALSAAVAVFRMESSTPDFDPQYMRVVVERTMRYGGSYYENAIHNKGPLEPVLYELAGRIGGRDGWWFVIAVMALAAAVAIGWAVASVARDCGAPSVIGLSVAVMAVAHFTLSEADYAGVLYARNMVVALLSVAFAVTLTDRCWVPGRRTGLAVVIVGVCTGLAVQTLFTACFSAGPVLLFAMWARRGVVVAHRPAWLVLPAVAAAAFVSAPVTYAVADLLGWGSFDDFADGWWTYARFMSDATGRGLGGQIALAWDRAFDYYRDRPAVAIVVQLWIVVTAVRWRRLDTGERVLAALLAAWFTGAWVELAVSQRYSSHYFSVLAVPTVMMIAQLTGLATARWRRALATAPVAALLPLVVAFGTIRAGGTPPFGVGIEKASTTDSFADLGRGRDAGLGGRIHFERAVLSAFSERGDPLLAWTSYPWMYLDRQRVSATRYIWKEFLLGEIYLAGRSEKYVLPGTWERWEREVLATDPVAYIVESVNPVERGTPFEHVVGERFHTMHVDAEATLALRNDVAAWLLAPPGTATPGRPLRGGQLANAGCVRIDGTLAPGETTFVIGAGTDTPAMISASLDSSGAGTVHSERHGVAGYDVPTPAGPLSFSLVAGARATLLMIGGQVVGAVERGGTTIDAGGDGAGALLAGGFTTSAPHPLSGCGDGDSGLEQARSVPVPG
jgi:hypothetical protein